MAKGRNPLSVGMKQNKEDFNRELKTYSTKALKNIITIAENSFDANTRLKANMFLIEKAVGKNYSVLEHNNDAEHNKQTQITLQIIEPNKNINVDKINDEIAELTDSTDNDDSEPWEEPWEKPWEEDIYHTH